MMEKVLYAADELTGLIGAAALMRPSKSVQDMEVKSIKCISNEYDGDGSDFEKNVRTSANKAFIFMDQLINQIN